MPKAITPLYNAQAELDQEWGLIYERTVEPNESLIFFFTSPTAEEEYKRDYLEAIKRINDKYDAYTTKASFDTICLNNVYKTHSKQSWREDWMTATWETLYPKETKAAREAAQKREAKKAAKAAKEAEHKIKICDEIQIELSVISL
jgi:hypothetical protein